MCKRHAAEHAAETKRKRAEEAERRREEGLEGDEDDDEAGRLPPVRITWPALLGLFVKATTTRDFCDWAVTLDDNDNLLSLTDPKEFARFVANELWEATGFRWM